MPARAARLVHTRTSQQRILSSFQSNSSQPHPPTTPHHTPPVHSLTYCFLSIFSFFSCLVYPTPHAAWQSPSQSRKSVYSVYSVHSVHSVHRCHRLYDASFVLVFVCVIDASADRAVSVCSPTTRGGKEVNTTTQWQDIRFGYPLQTRRQTTACCLRTSLNSHASLTILGCAVLNRKRAPQPHGAKRWFA